MADRPRASIGNGALFMTNPAPTKKRPRLRGAANNREGLLSAFGAANAVSASSKQRPFSGEGDFVSPKEAYSIQVGEYHSGMGVSTLQVTRYE